MATKIRPVVKIETKRLVSMSVLFYANTTFTNGFRFELIVGHGDIHLIDDVEDVPHGERFTNLVHGFVIESERHFVFVRWKYIGIGVT
jgi:hypothetical protein